MPDVGQYHEKYSTGENKSKQKRLVLDIILKILNFEFES